MPYWGVFPFRMRFTDLHGCCMFDDRWFHVARSPTCHAFDAILGHISVLDEIYKSSRSYMITPTCEMHTETRMCSLSYHDLLGEPLLSHSVRCTLLTFRCPHASSFETRLLICGLDSAMDLDDWDHTFDDRLFDVVKFLAYSTSDSILGHIFVSIEIYKSSWSCMLIPTFEIHIETMTLQWSLFGVIQLGLHLSTLICHHAFSQDMPLWFVGLIQLWIRVTRIA